LGRVYGAAQRTAGVDEPAGESLPFTEIWDSGPYLDFVPEMVAAVRERFGYDLHLLHDVHHRLTPIEAARLGKALESYRMFWLEDATPAEDQAAFRLIRQHTTTPLAVGEVFNTIWDCQALLTERLVDYIRTAVSHAGGITHLRRIFALADLYGVRTASHGPSDLSPVSFAAALHVDMSVPNFGIQEYMGYPELTDAVFPHEYSLSDGFMHPGDAPGLGVDIDEVEAAKHPYERRYLPVARRRDGSVHDW